MTASDGPDREFGFTHADFCKIRAIIKSRVGIDLGDNKRSLVYGRLSRRLRNLGLGSFAEYLPLVEDAQSDEAERFVNALTTNVTEFFRESHHFDFLARKVLPDVWKRATNTRRVRIWSAGCSTGEEPYSIAMVVRENMPPAGSGAWDIKILATDLDTDVLAHASAGVYVMNRAEKIARARIGRFFDPVPGGDAVRAKDAIRSLITFKQLNLMEPWPMRGPFDVIFCRNVVIYFDDATKTGLVRRYHDLLTPGGHLFLGHSESLVSSAVGFESCGKTAYRKSPNNAASAA